MGSDIFDLLNLDRTTGKYKSKMPTGEAELDFGKGSSSHSQSRQKKKKKKSSFCSFKIWFLHNTFQQYEEVVNVKTFCATIVIKKRP